MTHDYKPGHLWDEPATDTQTLVECLGMPFANDEVRRAYFLEKLRAGLQELHATLGSVPFTTVADAVACMQSMTAWPMGDSDQLKTLAEQLRHGDPGKDLLQRWKSEVGFPHGEIEDILRLSDPPYYTACPNPFIEDFVRYYGKPYDPHEIYSKEPFTADVTEGKNDPIYNAHSYHTKVPHKAIMRYILHYTEPGDIVFDGFCGTGMTGIAAQLCGDHRTVELLGYKVDDNGNICDEEGNIFSRQGWRSTILNDLSPIASFIAYNFNIPVDVQSFAREARRVISEVEEECGWMFKTAHKKSAAEGVVNYIVWSDVLVCSECQQDFVYWDAAVDRSNNLVHNPYKCPYCGALLYRDNLQRKMEMVTDYDLGSVVQRPRQVPVLINYSLGTKRFEKQPDENDLEILRQIEESTIPYRIPLDLMCFRGVEWGDLFRGYHTGTTHVHHFYTKRNRWILGAVWHRINQSSGRMQRFLMIWFTSSHSRLTRLNRYMPTHDRHVGPLSGTYYLSSLPTEISPFYFMNYKLEEFSRIDSFQHIHGIISTASSDSFYIPVNSVDYIFTDPPFGDNLPYSELNFLWEAWHKVFTNNSKEAIVSPFQKKEISYYQMIMQDCFKKYYSALKPGRWITVEFHNSRNSIWKAIQEALGNVGFVVADVRTLDKKKGTTKQLSYTSGAVKQDLVISAYKPSNDLEERFNLESGTVEAVWEFTRSHLDKLPIPRHKQGQLEPIAERMAYLLFDRMVAFHVQHGVTVPLSAAEFYAGLEQRFASRDDMYFLPDQVVEYDRQRMSAKEVLQLNFLVIDESTAVQWLRQQLMRKPQTFQDLHPQFLREISGWQKHEKPLELSDLLEENFIEYEDQERIPAQIVAWMKQSVDLRKLITSELDTGQATEDNGALVTHNATLIERGKHRWYVPNPNQAQDLEKVRERALLREFEEYKNFKGRTLKVFRLEAVRAGFRRAWQEKSTAGYRTIISVAHKLPENILQEDAKLLMFYDQAKTRIGEE